MLNTSLFIQNAALAAPLLAQGQSMVDLPTGQSASSLLHRLYADAVAAFPEVFAGVNFPEDPADFRRNYPELVVALEGARSASLRRVEVACCMTEAAQHALVVQGKSGRATPLDEFMQGHADPLSVETVEPRMPGAEGFSPGTRPFVSYKAYFGAAPIYGFSGWGPSLADLGEDLVSRHMASPPVKTALEWLSGQGRIDLTGQKFVILGAGAELAPTQVLLNAGATVLYLDRTGPRRFAWDNTLTGGVLVYPADGGADLLTQPREIAATIQAFADGGPVHIGSFAYAAGQAREWRLTAAANAIVRALPPDIVASFSTYISPTAPAEANLWDAGHAINGYRDPLGKESREDAQRNLRWWALKALGLPPNIGGSDGARMARTVVPIQGTAYQAAQILGKRMTAELFGVYGTQGDAGNRQPIPVSANVAGITRSRSMNTPNFRLGFAGAPFLGLETYPVATTRALSGWLMVHDLLNLRPPASPAAAEERDRLAAIQLLGTQVHGGLFAFPFQLGPAIKVAAALGATYRWDLLAKALLAATRGKRQKRSRAA